MSQTSVPPSEPVRVLRVIARLNVGGPALHVSLLNSGMHAERFRSWLVTGTENPGEGSLRSYAEARGIEPIVIPEMLGQATLAPRDAIALAKMIRLVRLVRPHVVHTHTAKAGFLGRVAARAAGVPVVLHTYHGHVLSGYYGRLRTTGLRMMERGLAQITDRLITVSDRVRDDLVEFGVAPVERFTVVPLGLDLAPMFASAAHRGVLRRELGVPDRVPVIGIIGRLFPVKNHRLFLDAAARVAERHPEARFLVVGDGPLRTDLEQHARKIGLADRVIFTGWRHDLPVIYEGLDLLVVSSVNEGTPVSAIEAMAAGCPVVATRVGGLPDLVDDGRTGQLVPPGDAEVLAHAISTLVADRTQAARLADAARVEVERRFLASRLVDDVERLYLRLLAAKGITAGVRNEASAEEPVS